MHPLYPMAVLSGDGASLFDGGGLALAAAEASRRGEYWWINSILSAVISNDDDGTILPQSIGTPHFFCRADGSSQ